MNNFRAITLQQEDGYKRYLEICKVIEQEPSLDVFISFYNGWCFDEGVHSDLANYQYDTDEAEAEEEEETYQVAMWYADTGGGEVQLTDEEDAHLSREDLMKKAVKEFLENCLDTHDLVYDFCTHCEDKESDAAYVDVRSDREYCDECGELKKGHTADYCTDQGETRDGKIVFETWKK